MKALTRTTAIESTVPFCRSLATKASACAKGGELELDGSASNDAAHTKARTNQALMRHGRRSTGKVGMVPRGADSVWHT